MTPTNPYQQGLDRTPANYVPLSPLSFLQRAADVYPDMAALVYGERIYSWAQVRDRCHQLASSLRRLGISRGDTVSTMLPNVPAMYEAHFGVPMAGAVLNAMNVRLNAEAIAFMLDHSETKVLLTDPEFAEVIQQAMTLLKGPKPCIIDVPDAAVANGRLVGETVYEVFLSAGDVQFEASLPDDEWDAIALGYTSGTTGNPKGVVTHHRGAYLNAVGNVLSWGLPAHCVYLWTLPMFHCNGWCFPWTLAAVAGTGVCLRRIDTAIVFDLIRKHGVTHYCGAPIVHAMLGDAPARQREGIKHRVSGLIAGAAPPVALFERMERIGIDLTHVYGLTETYGPATVCVKQPDWSNLSAAERAQRNGRQGVSYPLQEIATVLDPLTLEPVPHDGETVGEIMFRGNIVMKGYLKNAAATEEAFAGGWFRTGDLAVIDSDGYLKIRDRSKDVIISGGENISSLEVEDALQRHPAVLSAAVVAMPDEKWGEVPAAFVELREGAVLEEAQILAHCREHLARYKVPKTFVFGPLVRTSTGKVQKFALRQLLKQKSVEC
ncbi:MULTISPECIES: acyl-CoA synthetase [Burkholderiales]|uniref:acyl-CoA synthetase n=1 Tax=Burkholderiales TaxID=80840 RepID=UPI00257A24AC|nr:MULTISPECIES: acyl-CoA synthetase [Burkholderiales]MBA4279612.1 acyl-CoA synthetase [Ralstonia sp.]